MFRLAILLLFACSEAQLQDGGTDVGPKDASPDAAQMDADPIDASPMDADPIDADPMDAFPMDADPIDASDAGDPCAELEAGYQALVTRTGCQDMQQCQVVLGHCAVGLGGCWYTVNVSVLQSDLDALADDYAASGCTGAVCRCTAPPNSAICDQGICMPAP